METLLTLPTIGGENILSNKKVIGTQSMGCGYVKLPGYNRVDSTIKGT
jgi:hypothetical protein